MSTIDMPGGGEYGLPNEVKFGDTNVPSKITEHYEAPENSRQRPRFGDGEILLAEADTKKSVQETTAEGKDEGTTDRRTKIEQMRQETKTMLGIEGTIAEDNQKFIAENNLRDSSGNFRDYTNPKKVMIGADYIKYADERGRILRALDLFKQEHYDESYEGYRATMEKVEESRRKIDSLQVEIEESKKRQEEANKNLLEMESVEFLKEGVLNIKLF